ncbi:peptidoglycan DD-metalloendopeptidase family protein [Croceiramulus getboli]|nr:peptidoglycan DD-metalloendopeptidase family protein [Flavobacteriaceae bacterium YJPT1-3]
MKCSFLLLFLGISLSLSAQSPKPVDQELAEFFQKNYNAGDAETLYARFAPVMQNAISLAQIKAFLSQFKEEAGAIQQMEFTDYVNGSSAQYKTTFDNSIFNVFLSSDENGAYTGLLIRPYEEENLPVLTRNKTSLILPFKDTWTVVWGGDTKAQNYHVESRAQRHAFDLVITDKTGKSYRGTGEKNEDYYAFGKELTAPAAGEVVLVVDGVKDNEPGTKNPLYVPGNTVILKTGENEYLLFAHFKKHSIVVEEGQQVQQGDLLGLTGNSGNSTEPHLHFHIQNVEDMNKATGTKAYFESILVNGALKTDYSPVQGEKISNAQ